MCSEPRPYAWRWALGLDTSDYTFGYGATWAGGGDQVITGIKGSCEHIQREAAMDSTGHGYTRPEGSFPRRMAASSQRLA